MKSSFFTKKMLTCLLCLIIIIVGSDINKASLNQTPIIKKNLPEKPDKSLQDPIEYVLDKLQKYDLVMIGERHWMRQEPLFVQNLIKRCFEKNAIDVIFIEFGNYEDQGKIDAFLESFKYDSKPIIDALRNNSDIGWGYQEYFDIFKLIYDENKKRPPSQGIKLVLADPSLDGVNLWSHLYECLELSPIPQKRKGPIAGQLNDAITDRDRLMSDVIEVYRSEINLTKGIYYAGRKHIRKDLKQKNYGRRYFSAGGLLAQRYPGRVCSLTFHIQPENWQNESDFEHLEKLFENHGKPFAVDTNNPEIRQLKLKSDILTEGIELHKAFDGYIVLNQNKDYQPCSFVPGFYDDEFAKVVWNRLRKQGVLEKLPPEFEQFKKKTPTGKELQKMIEQGLR
jgi:hypothetical protein